MKRKLLFDIAAQGWFALMIWVSISNIHRHPLDTTVVDMSIFSIVFFTAICSASLAVSIGRYARSRGIVMPAQ